MLLDKSNKQVKERNGCTVAFFFSSLFVCFLFFGKTSLASSFPPDSIKTRYDLNDPRNPDCPCYKYQKLADREFKKQLKSELARLNIEKEKVTITSGSTHQKKWKQKVSNSRRRNYKSPKIRRPRSSKWFDKFSFKRDVAACSK